MTRLFPTLLAGLLTLTPRGPAPSASLGPEAVRRAVLRGVEGDSVAAVVARWHTGPASTLARATAAALAYDRPAAERLYRALDVDVTSPAYRAHARLGLGWSTYESGDFIDAPRRFAAARAIAAGSAEPWARAVEAEALIGLSRVAGPQAPAAALALLDTADRLVGGNEPALRAMSRAHRAYLSASRSDAHTAAEVAAARALARAAGEPRQEALALYALAADYRLRHLADSAEATFRAVARRQALLHDRAMRANTLVSLADLLRQKEDLVGARAVLRDAEREALASGNRRAMTRVHIGLGVVAAAFRDRHTAAARLASGVANASALGDTSSLVTARAFQAYHYLGTGELDRAREASTWVRDQFRAAQRWYETVLVTQQLAAIEMRRREFDTAERLLHEADTTAAHHELAFMVERSVQDHGRLALARGRYAEARTDFARLLPQLGDAEAVTRYSTRLGIAQSDAALGDAERAERGALAAAAEFDRWRAGQTDRDQRLLAFQTEDGTADRDAVAAGAVAALVAAGRVEGAFRLAEHRRARVLAEHMLRASAEAVAAAPARDSSVGGDARQLAQLLPDERTGFLEYVTGDWDAPTTLFVLRRAAGAPVLRAFRLPPADSLREPVARLASVLAGGGDPTALARTLGDLLLQPALATLGAGVDRLVVVPDGPLHGVPFDALRMADGRFVVERYAVGTTPSALVLATLLARPAATHDSAGTRLLALADPRFPSSATFGGNEYRSAFDSAGGLPRLPASRDEARLVARYADTADVRLGDEASAQYLRRAPLAEYAVLHFATHALVDDRSGEHSALALSPAPGDAGDAGFVSGAELAALRLRADLVVLSACRSAGGQLVDGEGILGLTAPLIEAGARSVVATGWRIRDRETVAFVRALYDALAGGAPVAEALRAAKLDAIRRGAPPAQWAAFQVVGDPSARVALHAPPPDRRWIALVVLALAAGGLLYGVWSVRARASERTRAPSSVRAVTHQR